MTEEEFGKLSFHLVAHMSLEYVHTSTYADDSERLGYCIHTRKKKNGDFGTSYTHYRIDEQVYKQKDKFLEALKDFEFDKGIVKCLFSKK